MDKLTGPLFGLSVLFVVLSAAIDRIGSIHITLSYLLLVVIIFNQYDHRKNAGISPLFSLQVGLLFALGTVLLVLEVGGLGIRWLELGAVFVLTLVFVLTRDDLKVALPSMAPYIMAFAVLFGVFLFHSRRFAADSGMGLFPVFAGTVLALNLFVLPRYVSDGSVYRAISAVGIGIVVLAIPTYFGGDYSLWLLEVRTWDGSVAIPALDRDLPIMRSIFENPNTLGLLLFPGTVGTYIMACRTVRSRPIRTIPLASAFAVLAFGFYLSNSRASILAAAVAITVYTLAGTDRGLLPGAVLGVAIGVPVFLLLLYLSVLPIDSAHRFELWRASIEAIRADGTLLGHGLVSTRDVIEPYRPDGIGSYSSHNSYLSIFIRTGLLGGFAYLLIVIGPIVSGVLQCDRVNVGMLSIAVGFAVHQLFEGYTLYQFGPGSVLGALAIGYVIASLGHDGSMSASNETDSDVSDPGSSPAPNPPAVGGELQYCSETEHE